MEDYNTLKQHLSKLRKADVIAAWTDIGQPAMPSARTNREDYVNAILQHEYPGLFRHRHSDTADSSSIRPMRGGPYLVTESSGFGSLGADSADAVGGASASQGGNDDFTGFQ